MVDRKDSSVSWSEIVAHTTWVARRQLTWPANEVADGLLQLADDTFAITVPYDAHLKRSEDAPSITMFLLAPGAAAAKRAVHLAVEADVEAVALERVPDAVWSGARSYAAICKALSATGIAFREFASYRIATDGAFVHRVIEADDRQFFFRSPDGNEDSAYAIAVLLRRG
jgi:hypothetical protein